MLFLLLTLIVIISIISFFLARQSLRDYQEMPKEHLSYGSFLIRNRSRFDEDFLSELFKKAKKEEVVISFERLFKGKDTALTVYAPGDLIGQFNYLDLLELEDYTDKVDVNNCLAWEMSPGKLKKNIASTSNPGFLKNFNLGESDQLYLQLVCLPYKKTSPVSFQVTLRLAVISTDPYTRTTIAKNISQKITDETGFKRTQRTDHAKSSSKIYFAYKKRFFTPKEVSVFILNAKNLAAILNQ